MGPAVLLPARRGFPRPGNAMTAGTAGGLFGLETGSRGPGAGRVMRVKVESNGVGVKVTLEGAALREHRKEALGTWNSGETRRQAPGGNPCVFVWTAQ